MKRNIVKRKLLINSAIEFLKNNFNYETHSLSLDRTKNYLKDQFNRSLTKKEINYIWDFCNKQVDSYKITKEFQLKEIDNKIRELSIYAKTEDLFKKLLKGLDRFKEILEEGMVFSKSPYSFSFYICRVGECITWGTKPEYSYRLSDHWNFSDEFNKIHCKSDTENNYIGICQYRNGQYWRV